MKFASAILVALVALACAEKEMLAEEAELEKCGGNPCAKAMCAQHKYCDTCSKDMRCGWCESEKLCMPGFASGPHKANCSTWDYAFCSKLPCSAHTSCENCAEDPMCGWCSTSNVCTEGSLKGPVFMTCMRKDWMSDREMCDRVYEAPCPCPEADGITCKSKEQCERNNVLKSHVAAEEDPNEDLGSIEWYESVKPQIPVDLIPKPVMDEPEEEPAPPEKKTYPFPKSDLLPEKAEDAKDEAEAQDLAGEEQQLD